MRENRIKGNKNFIIIFLSVIFLFLIFDLILIMFANSRDYINLGIYIAIYVFITIVYILLELKNLLSIKTIFVAMYTIMFGLSPLFYYLNIKTFTISGGNNISYIFEYSILGYIIMISSFYLVKVRKTSSKGIDDFNYRRCFSIALLVISAIANVYYIFINRHLFFGGNLSDDRISAMSSNGLILIITNFYLVGIALLYENYIVLNKSKITLLIFAIINVLFFVIRGSRSQIINIFIVILLIKNHYKPISLKKMFQVFFVLLFAVAVLHIIRNSNSNISTNLIGSTYDTLQVGAINFNYIHNAFPERTPYQFGKIYAINIKMMMPGPDEDFTLWLKNILGIQFSGGGITPTVVGEGYINAGLFGVIVIMIITGVIGRIVDENYKNSDRNLVWIVCLTCYFISVFRGGFANIEIGLLQIVATYFLFNFFKGRLRG